jgi:hypothetical protein
MGERPPNWVGGRGVGDDLAYGLRLVVEYHQLVGSQRYQRVGASVIVAELHFNDARLKLLDDGAHLTSAKAIVGYIIQQRDNVEQTDRLLHLPFLIAHNM